MNSKKHTYLFLISLVSAMGGLLFGYDWVVIGGAKRQPIMWKSTIMVIISASERRFALLYGRVLAGFASNRFFICDEKILQESSANE